MSAKIVTLFSNKNFPDKITNKYQILFKFQTLKNTNHNPFLKVICFLELVIWNLIFVPLMFTETKVSAILSQGFNH